MEFNLADLFENAVDHFGDKECLVANGQRRTYAQIEENANRLAHELAARGIGPGDRVGIYGLNSVQWVETLWAVFKLRGVWVNINYRYVEDELRYVFDNADLKALVFDRQYAPRVAAVRDCMPGSAHLVCTTAAMLATSEFRRLHQRITEGFGPVLRSTPRPRRCSCCTCWWRSSCS